MGIEIERKFLVKNDTWMTKEVLDTGVYMTQGYLSINEHSSTRVRIMPLGALLTIKSGFLFEDEPLTRQEWEFHIPVIEGKQMLELCSHILTKTRCWFDDMWTVDMYHGDNAGLVVAEIELTEEDEHIHKYAWLGEEVSHDRRYDNTHLAEYPYNTWFKL